MTHVSFSFSSRLQKKRDQNMKCFLLCRLAWNTLLFWQKAVILSQEIHCVKPCPPSPSDSREFLCPLLVLRKKRKNKNTVSAWACALFWRSICLCVITNVVVCLYHSAYIHNLWALYRYDSWMPKGSCLCFVSNAGMTLWSAG